MNIEESIQEPWLSWMKEVHIPEMLATGKFTKALMSRVMVEEEMGGITYSIQYTTDSRETLQKYYAEDAERLRKKVVQLFAGRFVAFRTELAIISEH
jgi:ABC-type ATPase with predicted acetyltransferase domain